MTEVYNFDFFQIDATGPSEPDLTASGIARSSAGLTIRREVDMKVSNFGALNVDNRSSADYTRPKTNCQILMLLQTIPVSARM